MTTVWVTVENYGGLTEQVEAYDSELAAVANAKRRLAEHFERCHQNRYSVEKRWDDALHTGDCPECMEFLIGVYECPVHAEHS